MKIAIKIAALLTLAAVLTVKPLMAGDGKSFKKEVVEEPRKWWGAALSTGWDSLYMFRGVNVLRNGEKYGSGIYWTDLSVTFNLTDNDFLTVGSWVAFGTGSTSYKEVDIYTSYTHTFGDLALSLGYIYYDVWSSPLYSHELNAKAAYTFTFGNITVTPSLTYFFNIGPHTSNQGIAPEASSYLLARIDAGIPIYKDIVSLAPWIGFGSNFDYNAKQNTDGTTDFFTGANNLELGLGIPVKINDVISLYGYGAYSYQYYGLVGTEPSSFWGGAKVTFAF